MTDLDESGDASDSEEPFASIAEEYAAALRSGTAAGIESWVTRYPHYAERIRTLFPTLSLLERHGAASQTTPRQLGDFRILRELGRGGMGVVYEAVQESLGRHVALKTLPTQITLDPRLLARFQREAQAVSRLAHPHIVDVYGLGEAQGAHFYSMRCIYGRGLDALARELHDRVHAHGAVVGSLSTLAGVLWTKELTSWGVRASEVESASSSAEEVATHPLASAPPHAVQFDVRDRTRFHRNIAALGADVADALACAHLGGVLHRDVKPSNLLLDERGHVWLTDFGLAKSSDSPDLTHTGDVVGTVRYMAPERFRGQSDRRSDVYALGITLYELLTLTHAFGDGARDEITLRVLAGKLDRPRKIDPTIPTDLETIVLKAVAPSLEERYPDAAALAGDLRAFLSHSPISARPPSAIHALKLVVRRNKVASLALTATVVAVVLMTAVYLVNLRAAHALGERRLYAATIAAAESALRVNDVVSARRQLDASPTELRGWEWRHFQARLDQSLWSWPGDGTAVVRMAFDSVHQRVAWASSSHVWTCSTVGDSRPVVLCEHARGEVTAIAWNPAGELLALAVNDGRIYIHDTAGECACVAQLQFDPGVHDLAFSTDGSRLAIACEDQTIRILEDSLDREIARLEGHRGPVYTLAYSKDGTHLYSGSFDGTVRRWDLSDGANSILGRHTSRIETVAISPDGRTLAAVDQQGTWKAWDTANGAELRSMSSHVGDLRALAFTGSGRRLVCGGRDGLLHVWDIEGGAELSALTGHARTIFCASGDPLASRLVSGSPDGSVHGWDLRVRDSFTRLHGHLGDVLSPVFDPHRRWMATAGGRDSTLRLWDTRTGELCRTLWSSFADPVVLGFSADGSRLAVGGWRGGLALWDPVRGVELWHAPLPTAPSTVRGLVVDANGDGVLAAFGNGHLERWTLGAIEPMATFEAGLEAALNTLQSDPSQTRVAVGSTSGEIAVLRIEDLRPLWRQVAHTAPTTDMAFSPDGRTLASVSEDASLILSNATTGALRHRILVGQEQSAVNTDALTAVSFSPDGQRLAVASRTGKVHVFALDGGDEIAALVASNAWAVGVEFSPDGGMLVASCADGTVAVWDTASVRERLDPRADAAELERRTLERFAELRSSRLDPTAWLGSIDAAAYEPELKEALVRLAHRELGTADVLARRALVALVPSSIDAQTRTLGEVLAFNLNFCFRDRSDIALARALGQLRNGRLERAQDMLEQARRACEKEDDEVARAASAALCTVLAQQGRPELAAAELERALARGEPATWWAPLVEEARSALHTTVAPIERK